MTTSSGRKSPNLRQQKSPNLNLATDLQKNVKQWKSLRWWEVQHSPREGPCKLSQRPRALWEGSLKIFLRHTFGLWPQVCLQKIFWELSHNALGRCESSHGALPFGVFYLPPPLAFPLFIPHIRLLKYLYELIWTRGDRTCSHLWFFKIVCSCFFKGQCKQKQEMCIDHLKIKILIRLPLKGMNWE